MKKILTLLLSILCLGAPAAFSAEPGDGTLAPLSVGQPTIDRLIHMSDSLYTIGFSYAAKGFTRIADWYIGQSVAAVSSLKGAMVDIYQVKKGVQEDLEFEADNELIKSELGFDLSGLMEFANALQKGVEKFGEVVEDIMPGSDIDRYTSKIWWPVRESVNLVSPYGPLFHGLVLDYKGDRNGAVKYYATALLNPFLDPNLVDFTFLADMSMDELKTLVRTISERENDYRNVFHDDDFIFDLPADLPWSAEYHRARAIEALDRDNPDYRTALRYCEAALQVDPFDIDNYENIARLCVMTGNFHDLATYVMEGLAIDPDNAFFRDVENIYRKYSK